jgi:hypothetical protein
VHRDARSNPLVRETGAMWSRHRSLDWTEGVNQAYWDPVPWISGLHGQQLKPTSTPIRQASEIFVGKWEERHWRNVPGPIYGAMTDNCWVGRLSAPKHVLYGDDEDYEQEFLYRQPANLRELHSVLDGLQQDPFGGWASDGDDRWTVDLVRDWWRNRAQLTDWIDRKIGEWSDSVNEQEVEVVVGLRDYAEYLKGELEPESPNPQADSVRRRSRGQPRNRANASSRASRPTRRSRTSRDSARSRAAKTVPRTNAFTTARSIVVARSV